jgi:hypothetical protein
LIVAAALGAALSLGPARAQTPPQGVKLVRPAGVAAPAGLRAVVIPDAPAAQDRARMRAPQLARPVAIPGTVMLRAPDPAEAIRALPVERELGLAEIRSTRALPLGTSKLDLSALLDSPSALPNVATRLQASPAAVQVEAVDVRAYVVPQGLVVRSFLNYRLKAGTCSDPGRRAAIARAGIGCPERQSEAARVAAYSNPASARYVARPELRAKAIAAARAGWAAQEADNAAQVSNFRAILANPAERAKVVAEAGDAEVRRLEALDDERLTGELVATAETRVEDVLFIPRADAADAMPVRELAAGYRRDLLAKVDQKKIANQPIEHVIFLTGFTLGRQYEWGKRIEKTIKWCFVGCAKTYYAGARAAFSYGFGLRFPIELSGTYRMETDGSGSRAFLTANFDPINGSPAQYLSAGLPSNQLFNGQEFVAELKASAGFDYKLPLVGEDSFNVPPFGLDLAADLPPPFANGQFTPPAAGSVGDAFEHSFDEIDLLMGYGNWGAAGITVHPAVKVQLGSHALKLVVHDNVAGTDQELVTGKRLPLAVEPVQQASSFSIGAPVYNLYFLVTPGVNAHVFVDVGVWGDSWDFPIWFPDIAIELPPGGVDFACHAGTICRRDYFYTAEGHTDLVGEGGKAMADAVGWAAAFERDWTGACASEACRARITDLRRAADAQVKQAIQEGRLGAVAGLESAAEGNARSTAYGSQDAVVTDAVVAAKPRCSDAACPANLDAIGADAIAQMNAARAGRVLAWSEASPVAAASAERVRVELMNSKLRIMTEMKPDIPLVPQATGEVGAVAVPVPPPPAQPAPVLQVPVIPKPLPDLRKLQVPIRRP